MQELLAFEPTAQERLLKLGLGYVDAIGTPELRSAIASLYSKASQDEVLCFAGAEEPIFAFFNEALSPGDHVIAHWPAYQSLYSVAQAVGAAVTKWEADERNRWQLDPDELPRLVRPETKVLVINSPHNPSGALLEPDRLDAIVAFARKHGLWIFSDEVYRGLEHDPAARNPAVVDLYERGVSLGALAKSYGLAGLRIGWVACQDRALLSRLSAFKDYLTICNAGPSELLGALALRHGEALIARCRQIVLANLAVADGFLARQAERLSWVRPTAGTTSLVRVERAGAFSAGLLQDTGVLVMAGQDFEYRDTHFRLGLGRRNFPQAVAEIEAWLAKG
ncbi:MAG: aminotransferase [Myxococcaceae bacterium]|nr:aminotransferase [Myxococcaceae bacterium]